MATGFPRSVTESAPDTATPDTAPPDTATPDEATTGAGTDESATADAGITGAAGVEAAGTTTTGAPDSGAAEASKGSLPAKVRGLTKSFGDHTVIDGLDLDIEPGQFVALLGPSGCGKSTLLRILADLDREITGEVQVAQRRAVAFQAPRLLPWKRVWRNVILGLRGKPSRARAVAALEEVGLGHRVDVWPKVLSGGEAQRASLARALVREPDLLLLDEPFSALDALTRLKVQALVGELWERHGCAILLVTHDVEEALLLADRVLVMNDGGIVHDQLVEHPRPRDVSAPSFVAQRAELLSWLGVH